MDNLLRIIADLQAELDKLDLKGRWTTAKTGGANGASRLICVDTQILGEVYRADDAQVIAASMNGLRSMLEVARELYEVSCEDIKICDTDDMNLIHRAVFKTILAMLTPYCKQFKVEV